MSGLSDKIKAALSFNESAQVYRFDFPTVFRRMRKLRKGIIPEQTLALLYYVNRPPRMTNLTLEDSERD